MMDIKDMAFDEWAATTGLAARPRNVFRHKLRVRTVEEMLNVTWWQLRDTRGFGPVSERQLRAALEKDGLALREPIAMTLTEVHAILKEAHKNIPKLLMETERAFMTRWKARNS